MSSRTCRYLPELPNRGPGADIIGRTAALLVDMPVADDDTRLAAHRAAGPGHEQGRRLTGRRTSTRWRKWPTATPDRSRSRSAGHGRLAAALELTHSANPALADPGAVADLADSLAEGLAAHAADIRRRVPGATLIVQVDEPSLPAALARPGADGQRA